MSREVLLLYSVEIKWDYFPTLILKFYYEIICQNFFIMITNDYFAY